MPPKAAFIGHAAAAASASTAASASSGTPVGTPLGTPLSTPKATPMTTPRRPEGNGGGDGPVKSHEDPTLSKAERNLLLRQTFRNPSPPRPSGASVKSASLASGVSGAVVSGVSSEKRAAGCYPSSSAWEPAAKSEENS